MSNMDMTGKPEQRFTLVAANGKRFGVGDEVWLANREDSPEWYGIPFSVVGLNDEDNMLFFTSVHNMDRYMQIAASSVTTESTDNLENIYRDVKAFVDGDESLNVDKSDPVSVKDFLNTLMLRSATYGQRHPNQAL